MKKFLITLAALTVLATPAFAQSSRYGDDGGKVSLFAGSPAQKSMARRTGLNSFAMVPRSGAVRNLNDPAATGGGSPGYNEMLGVY